MVITGFSEPRPAPRAGARRMPEPREDRGPVPRPEPGVSPRAEGASDSVAVPRPDPGVPPRSSGAASGSAAARDGDSGSARRPGPRSRPDSATELGSSWRNVLTAAHLRQIFTVLEAAQDAGSGQQFKETLTDSLAREFGVRNVTFFFGKSYPAMFTDPSPFLIGIPDSVLREYQQKWFDKDVFTLPTARRLLSQNGFVALHELGDLPVPHRSYVEALLRRGGIGPGSALHLRFADGEAIVGMFDELRSWNADDVVAMRLLARHLQVTCRHLEITEESGPVADVSAALSPRQREVAELVSDGLTNAAIAERLNVTEMTVKKYVSRIFEATGMSNRSMLAAAMQRRRA
jgi:DNA-binding CsgD family transcriptional regulator